MCSTEGKILHKNFKGDLKGLLERVSENIGSLKLLSTTQTYNAERRSFFKSSINKGGEVEEVSIERISKFDRLEGVILNGCTLPKELLNSVKCFFLDYNMKQLISLNRLSVD